MISNNNVQEENYKITEIDEAILQFQFKNEKYLIKKSNAILSELLSGNNKQNIVDLLEIKLEKFIKNELRQRTDIYETFKYYPISLLELYIKAQHDNNSSDEGEKCSLCTNEFCEKEKFSSNLLINSLKEEIGDMNVDVDGDVNYDIICLEKCEKHYFHYKCMIDYIKFVCKPPTDEYVEALPSPFLICPYCKIIYGTLMGNHPLGYMDTYRTGSRTCAGYNCDTTIVIMYTFPKGVLPNGIKYKGTKREAYLPNNEEGREILALLRTCFERKLIFRFGISDTTGEQNAICWNGVHHKTSCSGGGWGYSNDSVVNAKYFEQLKIELKHKGITSSEYSFSENNVCFGTSAGSI